MLARDRRVMFAIALSAAIVLSIAAATLWIQRASAQISLSDVGLVPDTPESGMTKVQARMVLQNVGRSVVSFELVTLFA